MAEDYITEMYGEEIDRLGRIVQSAMQSDDGMEDVGEEIINCVEESPYRIDVSDYIDEIENLHESEHKPEDELELHNALAELEGRPSDDPKYNARWHAVRTYNAIKDDEIDFPTCFAS